MYVIFIVIRKYFIIILFGDNSMFRDRTHTENKFQVLKYGAILAVSRNRSESMAFIILIYLSVNDAQSLGLIFLRHPAALYGSHCLSI